MCSVVEDCDEPDKHRGLCGKHYQRLRKYGPDGLTRNLRPRDRRCSLDGCEEKHRSKGYCQRHYMRWWKTGDPGPVESTRRSSGHTDRIVSPRDGYARIRMPEHSRADKAGMVLEHIPIFEASLGRQVDWQFGETVHHKNGVKDDNRPENLELWVTSQPRGQRPADLVEWAREILLRYGGEMRDLEAAISGART
jgi:HNH endonuclease